MKVWLMQWIVWIALYMAGSFAFDNIENQSLKYGFGVVMGIILYTVDKAISKA